MWISVRWCRVGPFRLRVCLPGSVCKVEAARPWWNKVLRPFLHFAIACSGDGDGVVRLELAGSGDRVGAPVPVSSCTGVCSSTFQPCMVWGSAEFYRGLAVGLLGVWWLVRFLFPASRRQKRWIHGGRSLGCVPSRCASVIRFLCGSCKAFVRWSSFLPGLRGPCRLYPALSMAMAVSVGGEGRLWQPQKIFWACLYFSVFARSFV